MSSRSRKTPHGKRRSQKREGTGGFKTKSRGAPDTASESKGTIPLVDPETGETFYFNPPIHQTPKESQKYWALARKIKQYKIEREKAAGVEKPKAAGGRRKKLETAIATGKISTSEMWDKYNEYIRQGRWTKEEIYRFMAEWLTKERKNRGLMRWNVSTDTGLAISTKTIKTWFLNPANKPPEKEKKKKGKIPLTEMPQFEQFREEIKYKSDSVQTGYIKGIKDFYAFQKAQKKSLDPDDWTPKDYVEWIKHRNEKDGRPSNSVRTLAMGFRRFMELGCNKPAVFMRKCNLGYEWTKKTKPRAGTIRFITPEQTDNFVKNVPHSSYKFEYKLGAKTSRRHIKIETKADRLEIVAANRLSASTGARAGNIATSKSICDVITAADCHERIANKSTGLSSIRLQDIRFNQSISIIDPRTGKEHQEKNIAILQWLNEKQKQQWENIPLPPKTTQALESYLRARFDLKEDVDLNRFLHRYTTEKIGEFDDLRRQLIPEYQKVEQITDKKIRKAKINTVGKQLRAKYKEFLLFPIGATNLRHAMYCTLHNAIQNNSPVMDDRGAEWTPERLHREKHVLHLWRKSIAQNQLAAGVPLEIISDYGSGWTDLSTLKWYYGSSSPEILNRNYMNVTRFF